MATAIVWPYRAQTGAINSQGTLKGAASAAFSVLARQEAQLRWIVQEMHRALETQLTIVRGVVVERHVSPTETEMADCCDDRRSAGC